MFLLLFILVIAVGVTVGIVYVETAQRRIPIQYARRVVGRRVYGGQSSHLPLKINTSGVIPPIFASSMLVFPATLATFVPALKGYAAYMTPGSLLYDIIYVALIIFFCYFYTAVTFNPVDVADNLKKYGGFIPGIRPGRYTADYIDRVLSRITLGRRHLCQRGMRPADHPDRALQRSVLLRRHRAADRGRCRASTLSAQIETHLLTRNYEGFMRRGRVKSRRTGNTCGWLCWVLRARARVRRRGCWRTRSCSADCQRRPVARGGARQNCAGRRSQGLHGQGCAGPR